MNISHMRAFLEVATSGSFQLASERLHITQSTVSARIKVLESQLGQTLFLRKREGSELTLAGRQFMRFAHTAVRAWEQARQEVGLPEELSAMISLGIQMNLWDQITPAWIELMQEQHPHVGTRVTADYSASLLEQLSSGLIDLAITYIPRQQADLICEPLIDDQLILVSTEPRKVTRHWMPDYIYIDWGDEFRAAHNLAYPETRAPKLSVGLGMLGLDYILKFGGTAYFPARSVEALLQQGTLHRIDEAPTFQRPAYLIYPRVPSDAQLLETAISLLKHVVAGITRSV
ncbi:LysR family transcriptional regulator [Marinobacterium rhizophilum]|uniref:LysR family transcriptional regulator n=1 Tax=Marinobacterium rhizophilum TaxID=420402 RepID=A0ABY5HLP9_9GAMM|nr:LysR family transcriptional regulator [Marinobacterium rhizophilum]UTW13059.1 LysR family transcriptional regulator [Marinobacterium rhizophilum]